MGVMMRPELVMKSIVDELMNCLESIITVSIQKSDLELSQKKTLLMALSNWSDEKSMEQDSEEELSKVEYI
ncbi:hypothetical protein F2Q69_00030723 [Brassica cretica]|uniref:Uncharacterized protein n=1 Tax=Brassica cretica TaxID=69181 RepID=A0A8S9S3S0_BRACR|nr:hypothetical protein F2Q69_00030723 [Brassica cretica]